MPAVRLNTFVMITLLLCGLYFPTSIDGEISKPLVYTHSLLLMILFGFLFFQRRGVTGPWTLLNAIVIIGTLGLATLLTPVNEFALGAAAFYLPLSVLLCLNLSHIQPRYPIYAAVNAASAVNITAGCLVLLDVQGAKDFIVRYYSAFYQELVPSMMSLDKPVLTFGTHALAAFFYYMFFFIHLRARLARRSWLHLVFATAYIALSLSLRNVSGYLFGSIAFVQLFISVGLHRARLTKIVLFAAAIAGVVLIARQGITIEDLRAPIDKAFSSNTNGYQARYSRTGMLVQNIDFILENPFSPIGFGFSSDLWLVDSGPVEYILRGSVVLFLAIYAGLYCFFKTNLDSQAVFWVFLASYLCVEVGFSNLIYLRTLYLTPCLIVYCNFLGRTQPGERGLPAYASSTSGVGWRYELPRLA